MLAVEYQRTTTPEASIQDCISMKFLRKKILFLIAFVMMSVLESYFYLMYFADVIYKHTNPLVSVGFFPAAIGVTTGFFGAYYMSMIHRCSIRDFLYIPLTCSVASLSLTGYALLMMTLD